MANEEIGRFTYEDLFARGAFTSGPSRARLEKLGLTWSHGLNLCSPQKWDIHEARQNGLKVMSRSSRGDLIVLCGSRVAQAFSTPFIPGRVEERQGRRLLILPHPSGRSFVWNDHNLVHTIQTAVHDEMKHMQQETSCVQK